MNRASVNPGAFGVLLVVRLRGIKRGDRRDLSYNWLTLGGLRGAKLHFCGIGLCWAKREYSTSVLIANVGALAIFGRRVVHLKEDIDEPSIGNFCRAIFNQYGFRMPCGVRTDGFVVGISGVTTSVTYSSCDHTRDMPERIFYAPEAASGKRGEFISGLRN